MPSTSTRIPLLTFAFFMISPQAGAQDPAVVAEGLPEHLIYLYTKPAAKQELVTIPAAKPGPALTPPRQLYDGSRRWETGRTLRVCLFGANKSVATLVREVASEWNQFSSTILDFGPAGSWNNCLSPQSGFFQIRIGFSERGYWSVVGKDSESLLDPMVPSMNLEAFNRIYSEAKFPSATVLAQADAYHKAAIRHEFGHALGLLHEHQNPTLNCFDEMKWTGPGNVFEYFSGPPNHWSEEQVTRNLGFIGQTDPQYVAGASDPKSVMMYALASNIFKSGSASKCYISKNFEISTKDKEVIAAIYPKSTTPIAQTDVALSTANIKPLPKFVSLPVGEDLLTRVIVDLESNDTYTRRDARVRLADLLSKGIPKDDLTGLVLKMDGASYRYQLGVATALANTSSKVQFDTLTRDKLIQRAKGAKEITLKQQLRVAVKKM